MTGAPRAVSRTSAAMRRRPSRTSAEPAHDQHHQEGNHPDECVAGGPGGDVEVGERSRRGGLVTARPPGLAVDVAALLDAAQVEHRRRHVDELDVRGPAGRLAAQGAGGVRAADRDRDMQVTAVRASEVGQPHDQQHRPGRAGLRRWRQRSRSAAAAPDRSAASPAAIIVTGQRLKACRLDGRGVVADADRCCRRRQARRHHRRRPHRRTARGWTPECLVLRQSGVAG